MGIIGRIIYSTISSKEKVEKYQKVIRDEEWSWISKEIPSNSTFLDVGCGSGYAMLKAETELQCTCFGIDPQPGAHGVGRYLKNKISINNVVKGYAEKIPFDNAVFDVVFSSHVLEHVNEEQQSLREMKRVLKDDGILIIGMPTALMSFINLFSNIVFTTHIKFYELLRNLYKDEALVYVKRFFSVGSHSYPKATSIFYDLSHYRVSNWKRIIDQEFVVIKTLEPCLYPYPDYPQFFKMHHSLLGGSSVFFICKKKT